MAVQRYISTSFWSDKWIRKISIPNRYFYLYLMTNTFTNIAGIYEINEDQMVFDTGATEEEIKETFAIFEAAGKAFYFKDYVIMPSWPDHQKWWIRKTIKQGIDSIIQKLPEAIRYKAVQVGYRYPIDKVPIGHPYRPSYSDTDTDTDTDSDPDKDTDSVLLTTKKNPQVIHNETRGT